MSTSPEADPVGTVREGGYPGKAGWIKVGPDRWALVDEGGSVPADLTTCLNVHILATAHPVIGAVPGTPAAVHDQLSDEDIQRRLSEMAREKSELISIMVDRQVAVLEAHKRHAPSVDSRP